MATQRSQKRLSTLKKSRKFRDRARQESRRLHLEQLEDRRVMAVFVLPNNGALLADGETRTVAPKDLTFQFTDIPGIDPTTISTGIRLVGAGQDGAFGQANDKPVAIGFSGLGDTNREVILRFAENLPDDIYQITIVGSGATPLRDTSGAAFNGGVDVVINFRLDLGAQVIAVVPQPVRRLANGTLSMTEVVNGVQRPTDNVIHVYFNNDDLDPVSATRKEFYRLYATKDTLDPADDVEILPATVEYDSVANLVRLTFAGALDTLVAADGSKDPIKSYRLRIGTDEVRRNLGVPTATTRLGSQDPNSSFATALDLGSTITTGSQGSSRAFAQAIDPQFYSLVWPGSNGDPGHRDIPAESHLSEGNDLVNGADDGVPSSPILRIIGQPGVPTVHYNFQSFLGSIPDGIGGSQSAFNLITENQKQRAREIFELYTKYSGVQFVETEDSGLLIATGDMRVINPNIPTGPGGVGGLASADGTGGGIAVMDNGETWDDSYGGSWFQTAMHEIGHLLGLGHSYDLPPNTIQGDDGTLQFTSPPAEPVFPGDHDIVHMRHMFRPDNKDIDMYRFVLDGAGVFTVETFAERLPDAAQIGGVGTFFADSSALDTALRLYRQDPNTGVITEIARNDDYFSKDSLIQLNLEAGTYFVGVSASGNDVYDPSILDSGMGGTTQGPYEVKFDFRKTGSQTLVDATNPAGLIPDTLNVPLDGDADGNAGGAFNFWFRAAPQVPQAGRARTIFVDKQAPAGGSGFISAPFKNIDDAMAAATEYDIIRIVGNGGADGNLATLQDNLAYQIGFNDFSQELPDGAELAVKKNVTVMIDAGAIFQMRRSQVSVGSTAPSIFSDRSGGALQVLGTPTTPVYFTSYDQVAGQNNIGLDQNPLNIAPREGNWGGLSFRNDLDRADGRFDHEAVGVFLNYVNHADMRYGGGQVNVNSVFEVVTPVNMIDRRPTVSFNTIQFSADAAMSANPDSFEETNFQAPRYWPRFSWNTGYDPSGLPGTAPPSSSYTLDYDRVGPEIHGNRLLDNTTNGLFVRTTTPAGNVLEEMTIAGRFNDTDIVHIIQENLVVRGTAGGATLEETPPPVSLITVNPVPVGSFGFTAGTNIEYKLTYVDLLGNEGLASASFFATVAGNGTAIQLAQLPDPASPNPEFVARKLYRRTSSSAEFVLVDQIPASVSEYLDRNLPVSGAAQTLKVLSIDVSGSSFGMAFGVNDTDGSAGPVPPPRNETQTIFVPNNPGTFRLTFNGQTTVALPKDALQQEILTALEDLDNIFPGDLLVTRSGSAIRIEFQGNYANQDVNKITGVFTNGANIQRARLDASLVIDPQIIIKSDGARIDVGIGATLLAEGFAGQEIVFTSLADDRYGAGGTFDTNSDNQVLPTEPVETNPGPGDWGGIFFSADSQGSIDNAVIAYAGGLSRVEGTFAGFNAIEIHQAEVRIAQSKFEFNDGGQGGQAPGDRFGRGFNRPGLIFVRGAQPVILENTVIENNGPFININVNALNHEKVVDLGRQSGLTERVPGHLDNNGPLILDNELRDNSINGMIVRGGTLTTESVWDDTDIVHVLLDAVTIPDFHVFGGLRIESAPNESLVIKASGPTAGFTATGRPLEIDDRIGGIIQVLGQPGFPVVMTGLSDDTEGAGFTPEGVPQTDTNGDGGLGGGGGLPTGPEVPAGTLIDNDVATGTVGHFEFRPGPGGISLASGVTAQGQTQLFINQDFIFDFLNFVDIGASGQAIDLSTTTITTQPTLISPDLVISEGNFAGANGTINWRVETSIANGSTRINNTLILNSTAALGALRFINYLDEDVLGASDDLLYQVGSPGQANFRLFTLDNAERIGFSQGGTYLPGTGLVNATYDGFAADEFFDLGSAISGAGTTYSPTGNIDLTDLPAFVDPALGLVNGLADVTTAMAWTVDPLATSARITTFLELVPQAPVTSGNPGEWQGIIIDEFAHDRNVETILEQEPTAGDGSNNATPQKAQLIGALGPFEKGGDENLRLGLTVHGLLNSNTDVDIFSFSGRTGTEVWIELDRTTHALDAIIELIDINGNVLARSNNSPAEHAGLESLTGIARDMQKTPPFEGRDFYTTNQRDPGMRVVLPGPANTTNTYFVRVRSGDSLTNGAYQLQVRLREVDELGGSTVRFAKIANATNGIAVFGQPTHSPLAGEAGEVNANNATNEGFNGAQFIGNLLNSDRSARSVSGSMFTGADVDWFSFDINYDATQGIPGVSTLENWWSTIFDIDYADGLARPNLVISVYDSLGNLVLTSRDSNIADDLPNPLNGNDVSDLSRGSVGTADPFIGSTELPSGRYFVAISADSQMPQQFTQFTAANSAFPLVRLEPSNLVRRIVDDHINTDGGSTGTAPVILDFISQNSFIPWSFNDVTLFVSRDTTIAPNFPPNSTQILTVDPFSGLVETTVGSFGQEVSDIVMHPNGTLNTYTIRRDPEGDGNNRFRDAQAGNYYVINTGNGQITLLGDDGIETYEGDPAANPPFSAPVRANLIPGPARVGEGVHFRAIEIGNYPGNPFNGGIAGLAIGGRDELPGSGSDDENILYIFNPANGAASSLGPNREINAGVLPVTGINAGTQIVERAVLNTLVDAIPTGGAANVLTVGVEATDVNTTTGVTTWQILDDYPPGPLPFPSIPGNPNPTTFSLSYGGPNVIFEFDSGPEALLNIGTANDTLVIRDGQGFTVNGTLVEFDTGSVLVPQAGAGGGNFTDGTTLTINSPDPLGGPGTVPTVFEFDDNGNVVAGNIAIPTNGQNSPLLMATRIAQVINAQNLTTLAVVPTGVPRISLTNNVAAFPGISPLNDTAAATTTTGLGIQGAAGVGGGSIRVRIEETSVQTDLIQAFALANATPNNRPANSGVFLGVSNPIFTLGGDNLVTFGFDGNRLNVSGATIIGNVNLPSPQVFQPVNSQGGVSPIPAGRVAVPFLAQDTASQLADRMARAINNRFNPLSPAFANGAAVTAPNGNFTSADPPLAAAAQAPGGIITGMTTVSQFDADGNITSSVPYVVTDTGGLFRVINPFQRSAALDYVGSTSQVLGIDFSGLETGPANVEGNRYRQMLFGVTPDGMLHAFNTQGILQPIFNSAFNGAQMVARSSMQLQAANGTALTAVHGLAFSTLNRNLWQATPNVGPNHRQGDAGHGITTVVDESRAAVAGGSSLHFGSGINLATNSGIDSPGGSHGTMESVPFSLKGYSSADNPVLYFNYFLETENIQHGPGANNGLMRDALRVFIAGDDGEWHLLDTNDTARLPGPADDDFDFAPLRVKESFDDTDSWRQARIELADFAGRDNLRIRFDFSTAGEMNVGDASTPVNGDDLRAVAGIYLRDQQTFTLSAGSDTANPTRTFEFDMGITLVAPNGARIATGAQFTVNGIGFEFRQSGGVTPGFIPIFYSATDSPDQIAQRIQAAVGGLTPTQVNANRVNLRGGPPGTVIGAATATSISMPAGFVQGSVGVQPGRIAVNVHSAMTREEVREAIALAMAGVYAGNDRAQIKTHNEIIRLIGSNYPPVLPDPPAPQVFPPQFGYRFVDQNLGPFADALNQRPLGFTTFLPGDDWGAFNSNLRGQNNVVEGIYVDDIIIGFAERGEMVTGTGQNNQGFTANPASDPDNVVAGAYQLEIRRGAEAGVPLTPQSAPLPHLELLPSIDTNDRLAPSRAMIAPRGSAIEDGRNFTLSDGINTLTFEFNDSTIPGSGVVQGRVRINYLPTDTDFVIAQRIRTAINSAPVQAVLKFQAQLDDGVIGTNSTTNQVNLLGPASVPSSGGFTFLTYGNLPDLYTGSLGEKQHGDTNRFRDQGQIILQGNEIKNASEWGILIDAEPRRPVDGNSAHHGPNRNLREPNVDRLVPGVVVVNNVIHNNGLGGLRISGDTTNTGIPDAPVPFARAVNNTFYGRGGSLTGGTDTDIGIRVDETAAPTLLNNIIANFNLGVSVDASSQGNNRTILGGMLFQGNDTNANVAIGSGFPILLNNNQPLFVNAPAGNFYLKALSPAIDSSVDSLLDRASLVTVRNPLGILPSPIIAPDRDGVGQLRVDDPGVSTPNGFGLNPFKDRGAIDRVDFTGPTGKLVNPEDNKTGEDLDPADNVVVLNNTIVRDFRISLFDRADPNGPPEGSDIDDLTVNGSKVILEVLDGPTPGVQVEGVDYSFSYDATNNLIVLTPLSGLWTPSRTYRITLDNSLTGITDKAGNLLQANQTDGSHQYLIFLGSAIDWGDAPSTFPTLAANNGANHQMVVGVQLGATVGADADGQPSAAADLDGSDDGVTDIVLSRGGLSTFTVVTGSVGKIDAWLDLDRDGVFDLPDEYIVAGFDVTTPGVPTPVPFTLSTGPFGSSYLRVRFSTAGINTPGGTAPDGEVEDYAVNMTGPAFHNATLAEDVDNNGVVNTIDLLIVLNFLNYLTNQLIVQPGILTLPITSPPYQAGTPTFDPTGGGVPGQGLFIDVEAPFGVVNTADLNTIVTWLTLNFVPGGGGEGEGEGEGGSASLAGVAAAQSAGTAARSSGGSSGSSSSTSAAGSAAKSALLAPAVLFASPNIVIEERIVQSGPALDDDSWLEAGSDDTLDLVASASPTDEGAIGRYLSIEETSRRRVPYGPLEADAWDDLLADLSLDVGSLPGDTEDDS